MFEDDLKQNVVREDGARAGIRYSHVTTGTDQLEDLLESHVAASRCVIVPSVWVLPDLQRARLGVIIHREASPYDVQATGTNIL